MEAFKVHVTFSNDDTMIEDHNESTLESALTRLLRGPAAMGGLISEVKVVDMLDCTVFLAQDNKIVFPST
jgi:spore germination protein GerM